MQGRLKGVVNSEKPKSPVSLYRKLKRRAAYGGKSKALWHITAVLTSVFQIIIF